MVLFGTFFPWNYIKLLREAHFLVFAEIEIQSFKIFWVWVLHCIFSNIFRDTKGNTKYLSQAQGNLLKINVLTGLTGLTLILLLEFLLVSAPAFLFSFFFCLCQRNRILRFWKNSKVQKKIVCLHKTAFDCVTALPACQNSWFASTALIFTAASLSWDLKVY